MSKQKLIEMIGMSIKELESFSVLSNDVEAKLNIYSDILGLVQELDEPEKVVIPQFVADELENNRDNVLYSSTLIEQLCLTSDELVCWLEVPSNEKLLLKAWLDGYEVEKEKLYYVLTSEDKTMLQRNIHRQLVQSRGINLSEAGSYHRLTEREIKDYDERYWPFAVEVAE